MALWMTVEMELFWLAVMLSVLCGAWKYKKFWHQKRNRSMVPVFFVVFVVGYIGGVGRMEYEKHVFQKENIEISNRSERNISLTGEIRTITKSQSGYRLLLKKCILDLDAEKAKFRNIFCYVESAENLKIGMRIRVSGEIEIPDPARNPGGFHYQHYCYAKGICGIFYADEMEIMEQRWLFIQEWARRTEIELERRLEMIAEAEDLGILKAVLLGDKSEIDDEVYEIYRKNGISHVLAISGLHVSVIGMGLWKALRKGGLGYLPAGLFAFLLLFFYGLVAGFGTSVVRAVFMMGLSFTAGICGRTYDLPSAMCIPAIGLLVVYPYLLTQASFQLSFLAVGAIFFPGDYLARRWEIEGFRKNLLVSASIQVVTAPAVFYHSFEIPLYSIGLNLVVIPLMTYVLVSGLLGIAASFVSLPLGTAVLGGAHYILWFYQWLCRSAEKIPNGILRWGRPEMRSILFFSVCLIVGVILAGTRKKWWLAVSAAGFLFLIPLPVNGFTVTFLDVGQGDGIILQSEVGVMLVDCGSSQDKSVGENCLVPFLKSKRITRFEAVAVSHGDSDHINGIRYLIKDAAEITVGQLLMPDAAEQDEVLKELKELAGERGIPVVFMSAGENLKSYLGEEIIIRCLHPSVEDLKSFERNEDSMVLELTYGDFRLMLTGDLDQNGEKMIMQRETLSEVTLLKAGHHGSSTSTGEAFLESLQPVGVIFSYGRQNRYGHPSDEVIERCKDLGAETHEMGKEGAIEVWTDGDKMRICGWLDR